MPEVIFANPLGRTLNRELGEFFGSVKWAKPAKFRVEPLVLVAWNWPACLSVAKVFCPCCADRRWREMLNNFGGYICETPGGGSRVSLAQLLRMNVEQINRCTSEKKPFGYYWFGRCPDCHVLLFTYEAEETKPANLYAAWRKAKVRAETKL